MQRLHGIWSPPRFFVWGEKRAGSDSPQSLNADAEPSLRHDVRESTPSIGVTAVRDSGLPSAASHSELHAALGEISPDGLLASIAEECHVKVVLAAGNGEAIGDDVPAVAFDPADAVDLLLGLAKENEAVASGTIAYWQALARYGLSLLARQQFAPTVESRRNDEYEGRWSILVTDAGELAWLEKMVRAMPAVCRAIQDSDTGQAIPPEVLIDSFLNRTCEAVIRRSLESDEFYRDFHERAVSENKWEVRWISSLVGDRRAHAWREENAGEIASMIRGWATHAAVDDDVPTPELWFSLLEPPDSGHADLPDETWRVVFEFRDRITGETINIDGIWRERDDPAAILGRHLSTRTDRLRAELARAAVVFPELSAALDRDLTSEIKLNTDEAHRFLKDRAPMLVTEGFRVNLPEWAQARQRHFGLELLVRPRDDRADSGELSLGSFGLGSMLDFDWRVAVGDERITPEEFEAITARRAPLVRLRGQWVDIDQIAADRAQAFMRRHAGRPLTLAEAIRLAAGIEEEDTGLPIVGLAGTSWLERLFAQVPETRVERTSQPEGFNGTLRPYQQRGLEWLSFLNRVGIGGCLADDMGLGKTIQLIALLLYERQQYPAIGPTLLFVPMSVVGNWHREIQRFAETLKVMVHHGAERLAGDAFVEKASQSHVVITTYGLAHRDMKALSRVKWHRIALDEAQKIKNPSANQTIAIRSLEASHRIALTGTPIENHLSELWSIMEALNPGLLGSAATFRKQFAIPIEKMGDQQRAEQLRRMIRPFVLRRLKSDPAIECDLPEKMEMRVYCNLTAEQAALYKETVHHMLDEIDQAAGIRRRGLILATLTKLKQICNHPVHFNQDDGALDGRSGKCERIVEMLEEVLEEGHAALIFTQYKTMGDLLQKLFEDRLRSPVLFLHGGTPAKQRDEMVDRFQDPSGDARLFLLSLKAGGFGLNLTRANHVFHFDRWWNPAVEAQATDRAHRIGQSQRVHVYKFVCIGTIEDRIDKLLTEKSALAEHIVGSGDEWLTGLSTSELKEYLTLSAEAVGDS